MIRSLRSRISYSNVIASLALFVALGGVAVAAGLPSNSVGPKQLKRGAVTPKALRKAAVTSPKLAPQSVIAGKLAANSVGPGNIGNGAITSSKLAKNSVINAAIANGVVGTNKLGNEVVTTAKLDNEAVTSAKLGKGSVTTAKLSDEIGPLLGTLKSGQTLRGMFLVGEEGGEIALDGQSFQFPLANAPTANVIDPATATTAACPGITGTGQTPQAAPGQLCIYVTSKPNLGSLTVLGTALTRLGFGLEAIASAPGSFSATGQWAVTAP